MTNFLPPLAPEEPRIQYFFHDIEDSIEDLESFNDWLVHVATEEGKEIYQVHIIFLSDEGLLEMNKSFLEHDYYTDIITFPLNENPIMAELYISLDRVRENAKTLKIEERQEIARVLVHGILHLCGYQDKEIEEKKFMREKENTYLKVLEK